MPDFPMHPDREDEQLDMSVSEVWVRERISCPHRDILRAYLAGSLRHGERDYVAFHLETIECPFCLANLEDLGVSSREDQAPLRDEVRRAAEHTWNSSAVFLDKKRQSG